MFGRNKSFVVICSFVLSAFVVQNVFASPAPSRNIHKTSSQKTGHTVKKGRYLVPPPPAYMPSILPETFLARAVKKASPAVTKPATPKPEEEARPNYIFEARGHETARPAFTRSGVTQWIRPEAQVQVSSAL